MPAVTVLSTEQILSTLKRRLQQANREYAKYPNATNWNVQQRIAFMYQQAFYFLQASSRIWSDEQKSALLTDLSKDPVGNWGDIICRYTLNMTLNKALNEYAVNP